MMTPEACFAQFWSLLRAPKLEIWRQYQAGTEGPGRQREALELLASVVWHLELAHRLEPWPKKTMEEFYSELLRKQADALTPWKTWVDHYNEVKVRRTAAQIFIDYFLRQGADVGVYAIQNTLIADAAMRLDSIRAVLRAISNNDPVLMGRRALECQLKNVSAEGIVKDTAIVVAFRDSYLHAEVTTENKHLADFRKTLRHQYSLFDVGMACLRVWRELYRLCINAPITPAANS
jgi:hypothetical protein